MPLLIIAGIPLTVALLFCGAIYVVWRRRPEVPYARFWSAAFASMAAGWAADILTLAIGGEAALPAAAPSLCWLAAAFLFVHGLRSRALRRDRGMVLAAIWAAIAFANALLADLMPVQPASARFGAPLLTAAGSVLAAIAVRSPDGRLRVLDGLAAGVLLSFAVGNILLDLPNAVENPTPALLLALPLGGSVAYVAFGLMAMLLLSEDQAIALEKLARTDPLTHVWNRRAFNEAAPHLLGRAAHTKPHARAAVAITDIDAFKSINDRFGHTVGDDVLAGFAASLRTVVLSGDLLARLGGEEFALLALDADGPTLLARVEALRQRLGLPGEGASALPPVTASFGVAEVLPGRGLRDALERADRALYLAKAAGRNRSVLDEVTAEAAE